MLIDHLLSQVLLVARNIGKIATLAEFPDELVGPITEFVLVRVLQNVLVLGASGPRFDLDIVNGLQM